MATENVFQNLALIEAEKADHRVKLRATILDLVPSGAVCAEIGVFTGLFSQKILETKNPKRFYMVDSWSIQYGEYFNDVGQYRLPGRLKTAVALRAATARSRPYAYQNDVQIQVSSSQAWLHCLPDKHLDWVYIGSSQDNQANTIELDYLKKKITPRGIICGDNAWVALGNNYFKIFQVIQQFCSEEDFEIFYLDQNGQWAIRQRT